MENYKLLDACRYFMSGWIQTMKHVTQNSIFIAKCEVRPSYRTSDNPHVPWLSFLQLGVLLLDIVLVWLGKNTNKLLNYILENEINDYIPLTCFFTM